MRAILERVIGRAIGDRKARGAVEIEAFGQFDEPLGFRRHAFARGAIAAIAQDAVAGFEAAHAGAQALDDAGKFGRGREGEGRLRLVLAGDDQRVEEIERGGLDGDDRLARAGDRIGDVA